MPSTYAVSIKKQTSDENITESYKIVVELPQEYIIENGKQHAKVTELLFFLQDLSNEYHGIELAVKHNASDYEYYAEALSSIVGKLMESSIQLRVAFSTNKSNNPRIQPVG